MRLFILLTLLTTSLPLMASMSVPLEVVDDPNLYSLYKINLAQVDAESDSVTVQGPTLYPEQTDNRRNFSYKIMHSFKISKRDYFLQKMMAEGIFEARTGSGAGVGTAFLVANNLVLTNEHVAGTNDKKRECGKFGVYLADNSFISCQKIHYCNARLDFCLVELESDISANARILSLDPNPDFGKNKEVYLVGNADGEGLQGSKGRGIIQDKYNGELLKHYAPSLGGNSGSPLFNGHGKIMGINHSSASERNMVKDEFDHIIPLDEYEGNSNRTFKMQIPNVSKYTVNYGSSSAAMLKHLQDNIAAEVFEQISQGEDVSEEELNTYITAQEEKIGALNAFLSTLDFEATLLSCAYENKLILDGRSWVSSNQYTIKKIRLSINNFCLRFIDNQSDMNDEDKSKMKVQLSTQMSRIFNSLAYPINDSDWEEAITKCATEQNTIANDCYPQQIIRNKIKSHALQLNNTQIKSLVEIYRDINVIQEPAQFDSMKTTIIAKQLEKEINTDFIFETLMNMNQINFNQTAPAETLSFKRQLAKIAKEIGFTPHDNPELWEEIENKLQDKAQTSEWNKIFIDFEDWVVLPYTVHRKKVFGKDKNPEIFKAMIDRWERASIFDETQRQELANHLSGKIK